MLQTGDDSKQQRCCKAVAHQSFFLREHNDSRIQKLDMITSMKSDDSKIR